MISDYSQQWQDYRRRHRTAALGFLVGFPLVVLAFTIGALFLGLRSPLLFIVRDRQSG